MTLKKYYLTIIIILSTFFAYSNEIKEYNQILIGEISTGNKDGEIGDTTPFKKMGGVPPNNFTISDDNLIYVCDFLNKRINVYDLNFIFIESIIEKQQSEIYFANKLMVNGNKSIIAHVGTIGLIKIDKSGSEIFRLKNEFLPSEVRYKHQFFLINNDILYFEKEKYTIINEFGNRLNENESRDKIKEIKSKKNELTTEESIKMESFLNSKNIIKYNNRIFAGSFKKLREYNDFLNGLRNNTKALQGEKNKILSSLTEYDGNFNIIDYDNDGNSYWNTYTKKENGSKPVILVISRDGEILDGFYNELSLPNIAIAPNGDVYFMDRMPKAGKFLFYKITRQW